MPTKSHLGTIPSDLVNLPPNFQESCHSWTDDLPVCPFSGVGFATNQKYRVDGIRREEHVFEERSFHFKYGDDTYFYGVFDGYMGTNAADFAAQRMPAEILLDQLKGKESDKEIKEVLRQAFLAVEKSFFESIDDLLAEKEKLRLQLQGLRTIEALKQFPEVVERLKTVTEEIQCGTTAIIALVYKNKLYVANVGDSRALLYKQEKNGQTHVHQLSTNHTFENEDELLRLSHLGLNVEKIKNECKIGQHYTRCIGNYTIKGGYKEFDNLSEAKEEPIIAEPDIVGGIEIDEDCKFLALMSSGLYKSLQDIDATTNINFRIVRMLLEQFAEQSTLNGVAQAVVDKVVRIHHDAFMQSDEKAKKYQKRDDITLLVRNFNCILPNAHTSNINFYNKTSQEFDLKRQISSENNTLSGIPQIDNKNQSDLGHLTNSLFMNTESSLTSSSEFGRPQTLFHSGSHVTLDEEGRIKPYVDFSDFYAAIEKAYKEGLVPKDWLKSNE